MYEISQTAGHQEDDNVVDLQAARLRRVARINGCKLPLARMDYDELTTAYQHCLTREEAARYEGQLIAQHLDLRFPDGPDGAA